jgi:hypothetical protein
MEIRAYRKELKIIQRSVKVFFRVYRDCRGRL